MKKRVLPMIIAAILFAQVLALPVLAQEASMPEEESSGLELVESGEDSTSESDSSETASSENAASEGPASQVTTAGSSLPQSTPEAPAESSRKTQDAPLAAPAVQVSNALLAAAPACVDGVYKIGTAEELAWFRDEVNSGNHQINAILLCSIDLANEEWTPIGGGDGYATTYFGGHFDGAGHSVTGLSINASYNFAGLFGYVKEGAAIQNLAVSGHVVSSGSYVGGIVGYLVDGTVQNCSFEGFVKNSKTSGGYAGGIAGYLGNTTATSPVIRGCVNRGTITAPFAGGITSYAKYATILECYNTGAVSGTTVGGIAGQMQNNVVCGYCYSVGSLAGGTNVGEITGFLYSSAALQYCGYEAVLYTGGTGTATGCFPYTRPDELLAGLGSAYKVGEDGWPVLAWQEGGTGGPAPVPSPCVSLRGISTIFVEQGVTPNQTTITADVKDINAADITSIVWETTLLKGSPSLAEIVTVTQPEENVNTLVLEAGKGGGVVQVAVTVAVGEETYTDSMEVSVVPHVVYASVVHAEAETRGANPVLGELATVQVNTLGGIPYDFDNFPELNFKWSYETYANVIPGATGRYFQIPDDGTYEAGKRLFVEVLSGTKTLRSAMDTYGYIAAEAYTPDHKDIDEAASIFDEWYGPLHPVYGTDENIIAMVKADLAAAGHDDIAVSIQAVEEVYGGGFIGQDGSVEFYFADPNGTEAIWMAQYKVSFTLAKGEASAEVKDLLVNVHWDRGKVEQVMRAEILPGVTQHIVLNGNDKDNITTDLVLPKVVDGKMWTQIEWFTSDASAIAISAENQNTAETLFDPYVGKIIRGEEEKTVTLTAKFNFQRTSDSEPAIAMYKTFTFTIPPLTGAEVDALRAELLTKIDAGVAAVGFSDYVTGQRLLATDGVYTTMNDIQYPTARDFGVDGKYYPVTITSVNSDVIEGTDVANAARSFVYRPLPGGPAEEVDITVAIADTAKGISASRTYHFRVEPLTVEELTAASALMALVQAQYFEGLNSAGYEDYYSVAGSLSAFQEANLASAGSGNSIQWIYTNAERANSGIIADEIDGWAEQEAWRAFRSSDPTVLDHESLRFIQPEEDTFVRISSSLTHAVYGKYWTKFEGDPAYELFKDLYRQPVCEYVMVEGANHVERSREELEALREQAIAEISTPISATLLLADFAAAPQAAQPKARAASAAAPMAAGGHLLSTTVSNLEAGTTVFGLFRQVMAENNYTYSAVGSYVRSITDANGNTLAERDGGPNSGWVYTVNGAMPLTYMNGYTLKQGDVVEIKYTTDYTKEPGGVLPEEPAPPTGPAKPAEPGNAGSPVDTGDGNNTAKAQSSPEAPALPNTDMPGEHANNSPDGPSNGGQGGSRLAKDATTPADASFPAAVGGDENCADAGAPALEGDLPNTPTDFDDAYIQEMSEQAGEAKSPVLTIVLLAGAALFLVGSGVVYTKTSKRKRQK